MFDAFSIADIVIVSVILLGGLLALIWGFVRVVLVIAAWVGASFATLYLFPLLKPYARDMIPITFIADAIAGIGIFVVALIILSIVADLVADAVRGTRIKALDRSLGLLAGLVLGGVVVCVGYAGLTIAIGTTEPPGWLKSAKLLPMVDYGSKLILKLVPERLREAGVAMGDPAPAGAAAAGYKPGERQALDNLIRTRQDN